LARAAVTLETERANGPILDVYDDDDILGCEFQFLYIVTTSIDMCLLILYRQIQR
jgi:hypothetical protein